MEKILQKSCKSNKNVSSVPEGKKTFRCEKCGKTYCNKTKLKEHISVIHEGKKPFKCDICDYSCSLKQQMKKHISKNMKEATLV